MRELLFLALALFTALPAFSQQVKPKFDPQGALVAMNDNGGGTGVWLAGWFQDRKGEIRLAAGLGKPSAYLVEGSGRDKKPVVLINSDIKGRTDGYRYYAPLLAREIAEMIHIGMAESAEKRYMILACSAEVFFELWGTRRELPVFSGVHDEELGEQVSVWVENDPDGGAAEISRRFGTPRLKSLIEGAEQELAAAGAAGDGADLRPLEKKLAALRADKSYFDNEFKSREKYWWSMFQPR
jgi:hypothetical protein